MLNRLPLKTFLAVFSTWEAKLESSIFISILSLYQSATAVAAKSMKTVDM
jgi:hypothetical protein